MQANIGAVYVLLSAHSFSMSLGQIRRGRGKYWCALLSARVSFFQLPLGGAKVRTVQMPYIVALILSPLLQVQEASSDFQYYTPYI